MREAIGKFVPDQRGATAIEYSLVVALIVIVVMGGIGAVGGSNGSLWGNFTNKIVALEP